MAMTWAQYMREWRRRRRLGLSTRGIGSVDGKRVRIDRGPYLPRACEICGREFQAPVRSVRLGKGKTCSVACRVRKAGRAAPVPVRVFASVPKANGKTHPLANRARNVLAHAIRTGRVDRPAQCERCARACKPEGHHADYAKPLDVQWLCRSCHQRRHCEMGQRGEQVRGIA